MALQQKKKTEARRESLIHAHVVELIHPSHMYATYQNQHHIATCPVDFVIVVDFTSSKREKFKSHKFYFYSQQMLTYSQTASYFFFCATSLSSINRSQGEDSMDWKLNGARVYYCIMMRVCRNRPSEAAQVPRSDQPTSAKGKYLPLNSVLLLVLCALLFLFLLFLLHSHSLFLYRFHGQPSSCDSLSIPLCASVICVFFRSCRVDRHCWLNLTLLKK